MAKKSVSMTMHKNGSITFRSRGGVDLRKVVPQFFKDEQKTALAGEDAETVAMVKELAGDRMKREEELTVSVKPLEWVRAQFNREHAETVLGWYSVEYRQDPRRDRDWYWSARGKFYGPLHSEEAVKAAAQADYEARIRSALLCTPKPEAEPVAWRWVWKTTGSPLEQRFADPDLYSWTYMETPPSGEAAKKMVIEPLYAHPPKPEATEGGAHEKAMVAAAIAIAKKTSFARWDAHDIAEDAISAYRAALTAKDAANG